MPFNIKIILIIFVFFYSLMMFKGITLYICINKLLASNIKLVLAYSKISENFLTLSKTLNVDNSSFFLNPEDLLAVTEYLLNSQTIGQYTFFICSIISAIMLIAILKFKTAVNNCLANNIWLYPVLVTTIVSVTILPLIIMQQDIAVLNSIIDTLKPIIRAMAEKAVELKPNKSFIPIITFLNAIQGSTLFSSPLQNNGILIGVLGFGFSVISYILTL